MRKYTEEEASELIQFFSDNGILLISERTIGDVNLNECKIDKRWLTEALMDG